MADLIEQVQYEPGIYQLERTDLVDAGLNGDGVANRQAAQLANRTAWLKQQVEIVAARVTTLETPGISLSQILTITAGFLPDFTPSSLFSEVVTSTTALVDSSPFEFTPVSLVDLLNFYRSLNDYRETPLPSYPVFVLWSGLNSWDLYRAWLDPELTPLTKFAYEACTVKALMELGSDVTEEDWQARAAEIAGVPTIRYAFDPDFGNRAFLRWVASGS